MFAEAEALVGSATRRFADLLYGKHLLPAMMAGSCHQAFAAKRIDPSTPALPSVDCFPTIKLGVSALYEYVVKHRWPGTRELDLEPPYRSLRLLVHMRTEFDCEDYYWEPSLEEHDLPFERIRYLLEMTHARAKVEPDREALPLFYYQLEDSDEITIQDLALLTGLSEGAVRNAASGSGPECFTTIRKGKIAIIEFEEAQRWLQYRIDNGLRCLYRPTEALSKEAWDVVVAEGGRPDRSIFSSEPDSEAAACKVQIPVDITGAVERNGRIYIDAEHRPRLGTLRLGTRRAGEAGDPVVLHAGDQRLETDFRQVSDTRISPRASIAKYLKRNGVKAGDRLYLTKLGEREWKLEKA